MMTFPGELGDKIMEPGPHAEPTNEVKEGLFTAYFLLIRQL
jgi:hypothetical protein